MQGTETVDNIVQSFVEIVDEFNEGKYSSAEYSKKNILLSEAISKFCVEGENSGKVYTGLEMVKNPMNTLNNSGFKDRFATISAQMITPTVPKVTSNEYNTLYDITQVGFGDIAKYTVLSNELFIVSDLAEGIQRGGVQTIFNNEYTVQTKKRTVSIGVDWYQVASGKHDWGQWGSKVAKSFEAFIQMAVIKALSSVITDANKRTQLGIGGYYGNGLSDTNWLTLARNVSLANAGTDVYALGTNIALAGVLPNDASFRYAPTDDIVKVGYLPSYKKIPLLEIDNALNPYTLNSTPSALVADDFILMCAMGQNKPIHVAFEGNTVVVSQDALNSVDNTYAMTVSMKMGVDVIVGSKFGILTI